MWHGGAGGYPNSPRVEETKRKAFYSGRPDTGAMQRGHPGVDSAHSLHGRCAEAGIQDSQHAPTEPDAERATCTSDEKTKGNLLPSKRTAADITDYAGYLQYTFPKKYRIWKLLVRPPTRWIHGHNAMQDLTARSEQQAAYRVMLRPHKGKAAQWRRCSKADEGPGWPSRGYDKKIGRQHVWC